MKISKLMFATSVLGAAIVLAGCASAHMDTGGERNRWPAGRAEDFQRDRQSILKLAGAYGIDFHFKETVALDPGYQLHKDDDSSALELIKVIEDSGDRIVLQHLLVVGEKDVVKHWREVWQYEARELLEFRGLERWERHTLSADEARGTWTQSVFEVDDSPRYAAFGTWQYHGNVVSWESNETWRPLPRREYEVRSDYQAIACRNRVTLLPTGWVHEEDNTKLVLDKKTRAPIKALARETGINTYESTDMKDVAIAEEYWKHAAGFWSNVRAAWAAALPKSGPIDLNRRVGKEPLNLALLETCDEATEAGRADSPYTNALVQKMIRGAVVGGAK